MHRVWMQYSTAEQGNRETPTSVQVYVSNTTDIDDSIVFITKIMHKKIAYMQSICDHLPRLMADDSIRLYIAE